MAAGRGATRARRDVLTCRVCKSFVSSSEKSLRASERLSFLACGLPSAEGLGYEPGQWSKGAESARHAEAHHPSPRRNQQPTQHLDLLATMPRQPLGSMELAEQQIIIRVAATWQDFFHFSRRPGSSRGVVSQN